MTPLDTMILALADDELLMGHRASEWTGLGPLLEADLALSSIAQDEMGHALLLYQILESRGAPDPDTLVYSRGPHEYRNARLCELERRDWGETLVRHYLYDLSEQVRLEALATSSFEPLAEVARKIRPEERYHLLHGGTWLSRLARGTDEARGRLQGALDRLLPYAVALWEPFPDEETLVADGVTPPSARLRDTWYRALATSLGEQFEIPPLEEIVPEDGGRRGEHGPDLAQLLDAMQLLHREIPNASW